MPVGIKNPTSGDVSIMYNAIGAAQHPHEIFFGGYEVQTEGNKYAHAILRGYTNQNGIATPNYHYESLINIYDKYVVKDYQNTSKKEVRERYGTVFSIFSIICNILISVN